MLKTRLTADVLLETVAAAFYYMHRVFRDSMERLLIQNTLMLGTE